LLSPDAKLATYVIDDPRVGGVACYFTVLKVADGPAGRALRKNALVITGLPPGEVGYAQGKVYSRRRNLPPAPLVVFKKMQIVGTVMQAQCAVISDYTDKIIEGSPQNSTSTIPIMP
jgi:CreA protein